MNYEGLSDIRAYLQVIGSLMQDASLIEDIERPLTQQDFDTNRFYVIIYTSIYNLFVNGCQVIDEYAIDSYLSNESFKEQYAIFKDNNGVQFLNNAKTVAEINNYDYYYHRVRKFSLLRYYEGLGLDTRFIYDDTVSTPNKAVFQNKVFDELTEIEIVEAIESKFVIEPNIKYCNNSQTTEIQAGKNLKDLILELQETPDVGLPLNNIAINTVTRGARLGCLYMRSAGSGAGKAIPNSTIIPTPLGYRKVGDIRPGDYLFGKNGLPTKVLAVHPQTEKKQVYEVKFADGRTAKCCKDHLWTIKDSHNKYMTKSTSEIIDYVDKNGGWGNKDNKKGTRLYVPLNKAVNFPEREYHIPPYVMGLFLGDASFRFDSTQRAMFYSSEDNTLPSKIAEIMNWEFKKNSVHNYNYTFKYKEPVLDQNTGKTHTNVYVEDVLSECPELCMAYSHEKKIPEAYFYGSKEQRMELLRGMLDTDGHVDYKKARVSYSTMSGEMAAGFAELCNSLGYQVRTTFDCREKYEGRCCYEIQVMAPLSEKIKMFKLQKHIDKIQRRIDEINANSNYKELNYDCVAINSINPTNEYTDMTCFTVDSEDSLFLMNNYVVTHNTRLAVADACTIGVPYIYDKKKGKYVHKRGCQPVAFYSTEMTPDQIQTIMLAFVSKVDEDHILWNSYEPGEYERVLQAAEYIEQSEMYIVHISDFDIDDIKNIIKKYHREYDVDIHMFDYIQSTIKLMAQVGNKTKMGGLKEHQLLLVFATELKALAEQLNIFIYTASQLNGDAKEATRYDQNLLAGAKGLAFKLDVGMIVMRVLPIHLKKLEPIIHKQMNKPEPTHLYSIYKVRRGKLTMLMIWCYIDMGTVTETPLFVTDFDFNLVDVDFTKIETVEDIINENSVLETEVHDEEPIEVVEDEVVTETIMKNFDW